MTPTTDTSHTRTWPNDLLSSIVVFLVALPICMGIAVASGVPVCAGLVAGIIGGIVAGSLSGCPLQASGPAAGLTVIVFEAVQRHGLQTLGVIVVLAGILQILAGTARIGQWFRAISPAVVHGMLAGIGVLIVASQFHVMLDEAPYGSGIKNLVSIPQSLKTVMVQPGPFSKDAWHSRRELLQQLGELHRQQVMLNEQLGERIPRKDTTGRQILKIEVEDLATTQKAIYSQVEKLISESTKIFASEPSRQKRVAELGSNALTAIGHSLEDLENNRPDVVLKSSRDALKSLSAFQSAYRNQQFAAGLGILTIIILVLWKTYAKGRLGMVPGPLIAIVIVSTVAWMWEIPVLYVEIPDSIKDELHFINWNILSDADWGGVLGTGLLLAVVASAETLLSAGAVDKMHSGPRTNYNRELLSQGVGNLCCGLVGALPITGVIVRSSANVQAGAKTRLSTVLHGIWLLAFVALLGSLLRMIPTAGLAAILVYTGFKLVNINVIRSLAQYGRGEVVIYAATLMTIVATDLLIGVLVGLALAVLRLVLRFSRLRIQTDQSSANSGRYAVRLYGAATFIRLPKLAQALERLPAGKSVEIDLRHLREVDQACFELIEEWAKQYQAVGGNVDIDFHTLRSLVKEEKPDPRVSTHVA
ncbi:SulP family inorganic anion transporter [Planctomicrobium sp. SH664]|uniref:SulP family inorganic anion transporter n=1 Tax=Planctomicrobium sp. SH664 TaxID=3448125 RepID=UPI003F5BE006